MNKLVLLSEVRKGKSKLLEFNKIKSVEEDSDNSYVIFKEKFDFLQNHEDFMELDGKKKDYTKYEKTLNALMKRTFSLDNRIFLIEFFNSIYNDELSGNTRIEYIKNKDIINNEEVIVLKNSSYNVRISVEDEHRRFQYQMQFQTRDAENIAIIINKKELTNGYDNIVSLNKKKREYEKDNLNKIKKHNYAKCLIMLNSNIQVPDVYEFKSSFKGENIDCKINVIKSWKYDFRQLFEKNMYLLFPVKVLDLKKRLLSLSTEMNSRDLIKDYIVKFFKDMNKYLNKIKDKNLITDKDINEMNLIAVDLLNHFIKEKNNIFVDIKRDIEATLKSIVV